MAFLDNLDRKITSLGQGVAQKSKEVTDSVKISAALKTAGNQKKDAFEQLGRVYYQLIVQNEDALIPEAEEVVRQLHNLELQEKQLRKQLEKLKNIVYCPNCSAELAGDSKFCNVCGTEISRTQYDDGGKVCRNCGAPLEDDQKFCVNCGMPAELEEPAAGSSEEKGSSPRVCANCGSRIDEDAKFCTECGTSVV